MSDVEINKEVRGLGHSVKRTEDGRFIEGRGTYLDDVKLPRMLHMVIVRSQVAHGKILSIETEDALEVPGVVAVITGKDLEAHNLAWMPTLSGDQQAVMATDTIRFQGQEVAAVIAEDPYIAADAAEMVYVDVDELPVIVDPFKALEPGAPIIR
ncbi:MAG: carbon monoxide dehydrogenase, partial [Myxococcota bacterium]